MAETYYTAREWFDRHEMLHAGQPCAGGTFLDFISRWAENTQVIDPFFLFTEVGSVLVMNHHTEDEWLQMVQAIQSSMVVMLITSGEDPDAPTETFADSVKRTIDGLDGER